MCEKSEAFSAYIGCEVQETREDNVFEPLEEPGEYLVLTDEEADEKAKEYIRDSLWAFNVDFLMNFCDALDEPSARKAFSKMQEKLCEGANELVYALVKERFDEFVQDAIQCDGRGHFLSHYDGEENEIKHNDVWYFIYRVN
jgi:hypothetical protein